MNLAQYFAVLDARLHELDAIITTASVSRHNDANLNIGFVERITFIDGSRLDFSEQLPIARRKFRLH